MLRDKCAHPQFAVNDLGSGTNMYSEVISRSGCTLCGSLGFYHPRFGQRWVHPSCAPVRPADWEFQKLPQVPA